MPLRYLLLSFAIVSLFSILPQPGRAAVNAGASAVVNTAPVTDTPSKPAQAQIDRPPYLVKANTITFLNASDEIQAVGDAEINSPEGDFSAADLHFNTRTHSGYLDAVRGTLDVFRFHADYMSLDEKKVKHVRQAALTTCTHQPPHYQLLAKDLFLYPDRRFEARQMALEIGGHRLFTLPRISGDLSGQSGSTVNPTLTAGSSSIDGVYVGTQYTYPLAPTTNLAMEARIGTAGLLRGEVALNQSFALDNHAAGILSLVGANRVDAGSVLTSGSTTDARYERLTYSRLPALLVAMKPIPFAGSLQGYSLCLGGGTGRYAEQPTGVTADRTQFWGAVKSPTWPLGFAQFHAELGQQVAFYPSSTHGVTEAVLSLESRPKADLYFDLSLVRAQQTGETPFLFDNVISPTELFSEVELPIAKGSPWRLGLWDRMDLPTGFQRDYSISAIYLQDCLGYALTYRAVEHSIGVGMVINAFGNFHHHMGGVGFVQ